MRESKTYNKSILLRIYDGKGRLVLVIVKYGLTKEANNDFRDANETDLI